MRRLFLTLALLAAPALADGPAADRILVGDGTTWTPLQIPSCASPGSALNYDPATRTILCLNSRSSASALGSIIFADSTIVTVYASWVTATSVIVCTTLGTTTYLPTVQNLRPGVSFDVRLQALGLVISDMFIVNCLGG